MKSMARQCGAALTVDSIVDPKAWQTVALGDICIPRGLQRDGFFDDHVFEWHVVVVALVAGLDCLDLVNRFSA